MKITSKWYGPKVKKEFEKTASEGLSDGMEFLLDEMNKIVPHDEGTLEKSGTIKIKGLAGAIGYNTPYAIKMHEHPEYNFREGREGKWVEKVIKDERIKKKTLDYIANKIKREFG